MGYAGRVSVGRQPDGSFIVATGQKIDSKGFHFEGRPIDMALRPNGPYIAVVKKNAVFLATRHGVVPNSAASLSGGPSFRGCVWSPEGDRFYVSLGKGEIEWFRLEKYTPPAFGPKASSPMHRLIRGGSFNLNTPGDKRKPVPGGLDITRDGARLLVACANLGKVLELDTATGIKMREWPVQQIPFEPRLSDDERTLIVSNWGGRQPSKREEDDDDVAESGPVSIFVDRRGVASSGTVSLVDRATGKRKDLNVGMHPCAIATRGRMAWVANAASDSVSEIDLDRQRVTRTFRIRLGRRLLFGSMPNGLAVSGDFLYVCNGGDNALAVIDLPSGQTLGMRPTGFFPVAVVLSRVAPTAFVLNTKGNGSVGRPRRPRGHNAHDFQGTISVIDLATDLRAATSRVAVYNRWNLSPSDLRPNLKVYRGAIKHVLYIIKENRTYDEVFGDMPNGNGDARLCGLGEQITPNHHALARQFTLFDNAYVSGTNSAEGHQWALEGLANDYVERFYGDYTRSYPYDGGDAMAYSAGGFIWDAAKRKGKKVRIYGEFYQEELVKFKPKPKSWLDAWKDRQSGANDIEVRAGTTVRSIRGDIHPNIICWPLVMSDQWRADKFIEDYERLSRNDEVPELMILTLPSDHTEGTTPGFPRPRSMVADNDLALGRVVEAISRSPQWKETCIFVMEDDAQAGPDHVDGHRTVCLAISPYTRRGITDSSFYTQISILRSIELMLGLDPMTRFDAMAPPFEACFMDRPDFSGYRAVPNRIRLDDMNPPPRRLTGHARYWAERSMALDWSGVDTADWDVLNRVLWHSFHGDSKAYPAREVETE
jgi:hypothetical protein